MCINLAIESLYALELDVDWKDGCHEPSEEKRIEDDGNVETVTDAVRPSDDSSRYCKKWNEHVKIDKLKSDGSRDERTTNRHTSYDLDDYD